MVFTPTTRSQLPKLKKPTVMSQNFSDESSGEEYDTKIVLPDWVQDKINETIILRKNLNKEVKSKEDAIIKINDHLAHDTHPKSIVPNVKLHVSAKFQPSADKTLETLNKQYASAILAKLKDIRTLELQEAKKETANLIKNLKEYFRTTLQKLKDQHLYNDNIDDDISTYIKIYRLESNNQDKEYRQNLFFKQQKKNEEIAKKAAETAQQQADAEMEDPVASLRKELGEIKTVLSNLNKPSNNPQINNNRRSSSRFRQNGNNNRNGNINNRNSNHNGNNNHGYNSRSNNNGNNNRNNYNNNRNNYNNNRNNYNNNRNNYNNNNNNNNNRHRQQGNGGGQGQHYRNPQANNYRSNNSNNQRNGQGRGNQQRRQPYTNSTNPSGSNPRNSRPNQG